ncbi:MAG TPA: PP2C family protein-serine/threonine phosphatase [Thermoanaerobaculaceae bacterium]|nr:PP2C family protein-serine/threonine phosphatase [Thermoanaerobaculaceae bacterium]HRS15819.1 PP2C family protein-serine/threonine phosphatase [Thermoanaerobaculaceae bacterium]
MSAFVKLLEAGARGPREGSVHLPETVLDAVLGETGAVAARIGLGEEVLAVRGQAPGTGRRYELPAGRDSFWLETSGGSEPSELLRMAGGVVLGAWAVRDQLKRARFAERRRLWEMESLRAIGEALGGSLEPTHIAEELLLNATALLDARRGEVWLAGAGAPALASAVRGAAAADPCADGSCLVAARVGGGVLTAAEAASLPDSGLLEGSRLAVPISGRRGRLGVLAVAEREVRGGTAPFSPTDAETLGLFAAQAAVALESAVLHREAVERLRLERELELAAVVQKELLPSALPELPGFELAARNQSSRRVGGDVFDVIEAGDGLFLMLGDVAGKGVPAALMAASVQSAVRVLMLSQPPLVEVARQLHAHLLRTTPVNKFATVFMAYLHADGQLEYLSAGHNPVVVAGADGTTILLSASGPPLGLLPAATFTSSRTELARGALLLAYTDGISEAVDAHDEEFGTRRIAELAAGARGTAPAAVVDRLFTAVEEHTGGAPLHDDRTVLAVRRAGV